jgi:D-cysteine desulfhydrase
MRRPDLARISLLHAPTPIVRRAQLDAKLGIQLWIKRDDATSGAEAGNKIRKLELLLGDALAKKADTIITCGGLQSNHARATAIACAALGLRAVLFLRVEGDPAGPARAKLPRTGNVLLDRLVGAEIRLISREDYAVRGAIMESAAQELAQSGKRPYVIPEGGSNGLGAIGYVDAMREVRGQMDLGLVGSRLVESREPFDCIVHACGSGGTAAGVVLGAAKYRVATKVRAVAVCDDRAYFERVIDRVAVEARGYDPSLEERAPLVVDESARGPAYGVMSDDQKDTLVDVARTSGILLDPVYTGKAMHALFQAIARGEIARGARVLFLHTGGLPGLLAQGDAFAEIL